MPRKSERAVDQKIHTDKPFFLGWYDPDKKKSAGAKLAEACQRFTDKFGQEARYCLCSSADADVPLGGIYRNQHTPCPYRVKGTLVLIVGR